MRILELREFVSVLVNVIRKIKKNILTYCANSEFLIRPQMYNNIEELPIQ